MILKNAKNHLNVNKKIVTPLKMTILPSRLHCVLPGLDIRALPKEKRKKNQPKTNQPNKQTNKTKQKNNNKPTTTKNKNKNKNKSKKKKKRKI